MKKTLILLFALLLFLCGCSEKQTVTVTEAATSEETKTEQSLPETQPSVPETKEPITAETTDENMAGEHVHAWETKSTAAASCSKSGLKVYTCSCGEQKEEVLLGPPHDFVSKGCGNRMRCKNCNCEGDLSPHRFEKNECLLCKLTVTSPVFVKNAQLDFDESKESIIEKLGKPTEILVEGELEHLVYASDLSRLTVVQTDDMGLWGVFTLDPAAFFYIDGQIVKTDGFAGKPDVYSDTSYLDFSACRVYGFRDNLGSLKHYGMWLRYAECEYHFLTDPNVGGIYEVQSRLSFYYVNGLRQMNGLTPLNWSDEAAKVSREYSEKMAKEDFFNHDDLYGTRLKNAGISWKSCGENISQGYANAFFVVDAYYNCADHRSNILNSSFTNVGMGFYRQTKNGDLITVYGTQTFFS